MTETNPMRDSQEVEPICDAYPVYANPEVAGL